MKTVIESDKVRTIWTGDKTTTDLIPNLTIKHPLNDINKTMESIRAMLRKTDAIPG